MVTGHSVVEHGPSACFVPTMKCLALRGSLDRHFLDDEKCTQKSSPDGVELLQVKTMGLQLTAAQASAVTGLSLKAINKAIDRGAIPSTAKAKNGIRRRYVSELALVCLKLEAKGLGELPLSFRKKIFHLVLTHPEMDVVRPVEAVQIDVQQAHREVLESVGTLKQAEQMVTVDEDVMGGAPVIAGTRIPVAALSEMLAQGATAEEIADGHPSLSAEQVRLAPIYVAAHPRRGRPASRPWAENAIQIRKTLVPIGAARER